jgi:hypothetical protein
MDTKFRSAVLRIAAVNAAWTIFEPPRSPVRLLMLCRSQVQLAARAVVRVASDAGSACSAFRKS